MPNEKSSKKFQKFHCFECDYLTSRESQWKRHTETKKHKILTIPNYDNVQIRKCLCGREYKHSSSLCAHKKKCKFEKTPHHNSKMIKMIKNDKKMIKNDKCPKMSFLCDCGKTYKYQSGLSRHQSTCKNNKYPLSIVSATTTTDEDTLKDMFIKIIQQNSEVIMKHDELMSKNDELMEQCIEIAQKPTTINNTQFNVMNYLNTECKDAMNISDFINDFQFSLKDLEILGTKGYQEAMEQTFVKQLFDMDKTKRPIHCSDKKRKSFYIKDNDVWEKDDNNEKLILGMKNLSNVHNRAISNWQRSNNDWLDNDRKHDFYLKYVFEFTKCGHEKERNKIINKLVALTIK